MHRTTIRLILFSITAALMGMGLLVAFVSESQASGALPETAAPAAPAQSTADHSQFEILQQDFETGPEVTAACLTCHTEAAGQIMKTTHWTWEYTDPQTGDALGKNNVVNSFCTSIASNEPRCTSCHIGYGYADKTFDFTVETNVDCLVCHDTTGQYKKIPNGAGHPVYGDTPVEFPGGSGKMWAPVDLALVAQNVGHTSRETCGACHFYGGGDNGVKHGDLDKSLVTPDHALDVHMDADGLNFACSTCHMPEGHAIPGGHYQMTAKDSDGIDILHQSGTLTCENCHGLAPHPADLTSAEALNRHVDSIACQTCHIPAYARGGYPTKTWWDWSTAGRKDANGKPYAEYDENGWVTYLSEKGNFTWEENVQPEYFWFDGNIDYQGMKPFDGNATLVEVNQIHGTPGAPDSRIWPFKVMRGKQPYDTVNLTLAKPHVYGKDDSSYWSNYDWSKAIPVGMEAAGAEYSGEYGFIETRMYWPITHMVAPSEEALECDSCHTRGNGILAGVEGVYIPGITHTPLIDTIGGYGILLVLAGVFVHSLARVIGNQIFKQKTKGI